MNLHDPVAILRELASQLSERSQRAHWERNSLDPGHGALESIQATTRAETLAEVADTITDLLDCAERDQEAATPSTVKE